MKDFSDYSNAIDAGRLLRRDHYKPRSTSKTRKKIARAALFGTTPFIMAPLGLFVGPAASLCSYLVGLTMKGLSEASGKESLGIKIQNTRYAAVNRLEIQSQVMYHTRNKKLSELAGSRAGTTGVMSVSELLPGIVSHLILALRIHKSEPFPPGHNVEGVDNTQDAIALYEKFASIDYHFSKAHHYTRKLKEIVDTLDLYMTSNTDKLRAQWDGQNGAKSLIQAEINRQFNKRK